MRYALLFYRHEDTNVSDGERERREEQFTAILDGLRARGVLADAQRWTSPGRCSSIATCPTGHSRS
jgi:hypothetical protein